MPHLQRTFGDDYIWIQEFGNVNFDSYTKATVLVDPAKGLMRLVPLVSGARDVIATRHTRNCSKTVQFLRSPARPPLLLCMCPTTWCHRTEVAEYLAEHAGWTIEHLVPEHR
jgi:hypothetical protein